MEVRINGRCKQEEVVRAAAVMTGRRTVAMYVSRQCVWNPWRKCEHRVGGVAGLPRGMVGRSVEALKRKEANERKLGMSVRVGGGRDRGRSSYRLPAS